MDFLPNLLQFQDGSPVTTAADWEKRRKELIDILSREIYGYSPAVRAPGQGKVVSREESHCAGHAVLENIEITVETEKEPFTFPVRYFKPTREGKHPLMMLLNFRPDPYDRYVPTEEIIDRGFGLAIIYYNDVTSDDGDFTNGLASHFTRPQDGTGYGKIGLWAWAASRALDYFVTRDEIDLAQIALIGHSRLGKTTLWCAAQDERFRYAFSNAAGCAGDALERVKHRGAEKLADIARVFPFWFCENYRKYDSRAEAMPFDQHFLLAAIAPRFVGIGSANRDLWADPYSEQLCCVAASPAWKVCGKVGFIGPEEPAATGDCYQTGDLTYHLRDGVHYLSRADWLHYMDFMDRHLHD